MAQRRSAPINAPMTEAAKAEDVTITGDWTFTGTTTLSGTLNAGATTFTEDVQFTKARSTDVAAFTVVSSSPQIEFDDTDFTTGDQSKWGFGASAQSFLLRSLDDDGTDGVTFMQFDRTGSAFTSCIINTDPDFQLQFGTGNSNIQYTKLTAGDAIFDLNTIVQTSASDKAYLRIGRTTDCLEHYVYFNKGDGSTGTGMIYQYDNAGSAGYLSLNNGTELRIRDGAKFRIYDSTDVDQVEMYHNGTDFYVDGVAGSTTYIRIDGMVGTLNLAGMEERWYATANLNSVRVEHDGTYGVLHIGNNDDSTEAIKLSGSVSDHIFPGFQVLASDQRIIADDGTDTWALECDGGIYWVMAGSTSSSEVHYMNANWNGTATHATISTNASTHYALGTGSNPDTDGDHNIWFTNGGKTLNIKNRRGASRYYCIYVMSGRS